MNTTTQQNPSPLITDDHYLGMPLAEGGPFHQHKLESALNTIIGSLEDNNVLLRVTFKLLIPPSAPLRESAFLNGLMRRFLDSVKAMMIAKQKQLSASNPYLRKACLDFIWSTLPDYDGCPCYGVMLLINQEGYSRHGNHYSDQDTLRWRIQQSWSKALGITFQDSIRAVRLTHSSFASVRNQTGDIGELFRTASHLCRTSTTDYGLGSMPFGCSRPASQDYRRYQAAAQPCPD